jgi:hypothetical protein
VIGEVGWPLGPAAKFKAELLVKKLKQVRRRLKQIADLSDHLNAIEKIRIAA